MGMHKVHKYQKPTSPPHNKSMARTMESLMLMGLLMSFLPKITLAQASPPLCISQIAFANAACSLAVLDEPSKHSSNMQPQEVQVDVEDDDDSGGEDNESGHRHRRKRKQGRGHGHGHEHGHTGPRHRETRATEDCCRLLEEVDEVCVCDVLRRLPPFLIKTKHTYAIKVGDSCERTYKCDGF